MMRRVKACFCLLPEPVLENSPAASAHPIHWLRAHGQHLGLVPSLGGSVAAWQCDRDGEAGAKPERFNLWRPWDGHTPDLFKLASFAMLPWSNRISGGGFHHGGKFHAMRPNRAGEPGPIHGDGWLQAWQLSQPAEDSMVMRLSSHRFDGNPYHYEAMQSFRLVEGGLDQTLTVRHLGAEPLPYGLGLHPWFVRDARTRLSAPVRGVWLSGDSPLPTTHTTAFPPTWDLNQGIPAEGEMIDNGYTGWGGQARVDWVGQGLWLTATMPDFEADGGVDHHYCLVYRPPFGEAFCFEPITQPIDAFHLPGMPGLRILQQGQEMALKVQWRFGVAG